MQERQYVHLEIYGLKNRRVCIQTRLFPFQ